MDLIKLIFNDDNKILTFLLTSIFAFISWLIKGLIEKPLNSSKATFEKYFEKRIELLAEIKTRLNLIAYFPTHKDSKEYKNQIQEIFLKDGRIVYLDKNIYDNVLKISISTELDVSLLLNTIKDIDTELLKLVSQVRDETSFYLNFAGHTPIKRLQKITKLYLLYLLVFIAIFILVFFIGYLLLSISICLKLLGIVLLILVFCVVCR